MRMQVLNCHIYKEFINRNNNNSNKDILQKVCQLKVFDNVRVFGKYIVRVGQCQRTSQKLVSIPVMWQIDSGEFCRSS